jgi:hypothetical protein
MARVQWSCLLLGRQASSTRPCVRQAGARQVRKCRGMSVCPCGLLWVHLLSTNTRCSQSWWFGECVCVVLSVVCTAGVQLWRATVVSATGPASAAMVWCCSAAAARGCPSSCSWAPCVNNTFPIKRHEQLLCFLPPCWTSVLCAANQRHCSVQQPRETWPVTDPHTEKPCSKPS